MSDLNWTGERLVTQIKDKPGAVEHLHRYALAMQIVKDKVVLDIASGEGYGSNLLSYNAKKVYGVDISTEAVTHANIKYGKSNLDFVTGSTSKIPLADTSVDVVISFETIEHHDEHQLMMNEIKRVLKSNGVLLISSPEKNNYKFRERNNPYHVKELTLDEFENLLKKNFKYYKIFNQRFVYGSIINRITDSNNASGFNFFDGGYLNITNNISDVDELHYDNIHNKPYFNLALASEADVNIIPLADTSFFNAIEVFYKQIEAIRNSHSFRIGNLILKPFSFIKSLTAKLRG
jgi:ubiquinone/menaquinone biosynthesis C-methylase UbiE